MYPTRSNTYAIGAGLQTRNPTAGTTTFTGSTVSWRGARADRVLVRAEEVFVRSGGALLGCTLTIPPGSGRRPGIVFAHGGGQAPRAYNSISQLYFNHLGIVTLSCDKRGIGQSGGSYPGDFPTAQVVDRYARDVEAQARFLAAQAEIDPSRIGVAGASQAGWIMPLAAVREPAIRFMVGLVSPTLTQGETDLWANLNGQGQSQPTRTDEDMEAEVRRAAPSGVDPMPSIRAMRIPALWLYGGKDRIVPSRICVERLDPVSREPGRDFTYRVFPGGTHGLVLTANGLLAEAGRLEPHGRRALPGDPRLAADEGFLRDFLAPAATMSAMKILVVDDERAVRDSLRRALELQGYDVALAADGAEALAQLEANGQVDAVLLDVLMPGIDGLEVCRRIRGSGSEIPVLMLTARDAVGDRVAGLDAGADDYVVKPFALEELLARVRALLRRASPTGDGVLRFADIELDTGTREVRRGGDTIELTRTEFNLLELFLLNPRQVLTRSIIFERVWGYDFGFASNSLDVYIGYLRRKTEAGAKPRLIHTVRGVGYALREQ